MKALTIRAVLAALSAGVSTGALAQTTPAAAPPAEPAAASASATVADIVVTAQRRSENLQRVPIAVSTFTSSELRASSIRSTSALTSVTPAITLLNSAGFVEPRIRGIGNTSGGPGIENSVATYIDGVYIASAPGTATSLSNVERVEVLKGPQGTLFGRNATGGLIQIITKDPGSTFGGVAHIGYGSFQTLTGDFYVSTPLGEKTGIDLAFAGTHMGEGYGKNLTNGDDINKTNRDISLRSKLVSHLSNTTTVRLAVDYANQKSSDPAPVPESGTVTNVYRDGANRPIPIFNSKWDGQVDGPINHFNRAGGVSLKIDQELGGTTLTSTTAYRLEHFRQIFDADFSPAPATYEDYTQKDRQFSQELQLSSSSHGRFRWVIGAYYFHLNGRYDPFGLAFGTGAARRSTALYDTSLTDSIAGYAQATWAIDDKTNLTGGIRYTRDKKSIEGLSTATSAAGITTSTTIPKASVTANVPTWRISLDHNFTPEMMVYASWNRGFKSGGFVPAAPTSPAYKAEKLDAYEIGVKSILFGRKLRLNAALFYYDYRKVQVNTFLGSISVVYNGAKAEVYGLDADMDLAATDRLHFNGGVVLLHDRFTDFPAAVIATPLGNGLFTQLPGSAKGNRLPYAPDAAISLGMRYTLPLANGSATLSVNELHDTGFYTQSDNVLHQKSFDQINSSLTWNIDGGLSVKAFVNNLLNRAVAVNYVISAAATFVSYQPPRTYGIEFGVNF